MSNEKSPLMQLKGIHMVFKKQGSLLTDREIHVLKDVDLDIYPGEIVEIGRAHV